ncbi:LysM peptidoglycan-binding domain-containing protein [Terribacillus saccharophilus]|uniref:LysM peptidoglycan-binding domain-containing protein n=1 Tax=Terribacillus saccharophilus TaxID=361277 RepID=UPI003982CDAE
MSSNETTPFMFDIQESLSFRADAQLQDLIGIALEPEISIQEFEHEISVRGVIELTGEYYPLEEVAEGSAVAVSPGTREMENVEKQEAGTNTFYHRFPVEISVPKNRIKQLNDVYVTIDNFDYEIPGSNVLELHATVAIYGVLEERKQAQPQAPQEPYFPPQAFQQAEQAESYTDEIADQIEAQAGDNQQYEQQGYQFAKEEPAEAETVKTTAYPREELDAENQGYQFSQEEYAEEADIEVNREETEADSSDDQQIGNQGYQFSPEDYTEVGDVEVNREETEADVREGDETEQQSYQLAQEYEESAEAAFRDDQDTEEQGYQFAQEYTEQAGTYANIDLNDEQQSYQFAQDDEESAEAASRDDQDREEQGYQFAQDDEESAEAASRDDQDREEQGNQFAQEYIESAEAESRDDQDRKEQGIQFAQEYIEPAEAGSRDDQDTEEQGYQFAQEYAESQAYTETEAELKAETRDQKMEEQTIAFAQADQTQAEAELEDSEASAATEEYAEPRPSEEDREEPRIHAQDDAPASPKVTIQAEKKDSTREESYVQNDYQYPGAGKLPEEFFVLPDELEDAYQAADFRQAHIQDEDVYYLDRELPHEEPSDTPDFTFTYQAKHTEEAPPEPIRFEAPPLLTPEEDDRWKYKETKTFSEFFGSKPVEPKEVPQAETAVEEIDTEESYEDAYNDVSLQSVPINQELQPEDLPEVVEEEQKTEIEEAVERSDSSNFLVHMFGAKEETYTKVRVCIVQERDTLEKIATRYDVPVSTIASSNNLEEETVSEGQLLVIPQRRPRKN